jgi:hypothetical protein
MGLLDRLRGTPTEKDFAAKLITTLRSNGDETTYLYDPAEGRIAIYRAGEHAGSINLHNFYRAYVKAKRSERAHVVSSLAAQLLDRAKPLPDDYEEARPHLRVKIWARSGLANDRLREDRDGIEEGADIRSVPVGEHLMAVIAYDFPDRVQSVKGADLDRWGVTIYEALEAGKENLAKTMTGYGKIGDHVFALVSGDTYDASRVLLIDQIRQFETAGRPVAVVANRDAAFITGEDDELGLKIVAELAAQNVEESYCLTGLPMVLDDDAWVDWMPPPEHPSYLAFRDLELKSLAGSYAEQEPVLNAIHENQGIDVYVSTFTAMQRPSGELFSYCIWVEGIESLLPIAQNVVFMRGPGEEAAAIGSWERVREVAGSLMEPTDHYPPRFRVSDFPDDAALEAIGKIEL